jgi:glycine oxidase
MGQHPDVLILGGGVIGLTTAWYLAGEGARVALVDKGEIGRQASWAGAGIIPPADVRFAHTPFDLLRAHSNRLYPELSRQLRDETGIDNGFVVCGGIELPEDDGPLPTEEWHGEGIPFEVLDRAGLHRYQTDLSAAFTRGVYLPGMAQVRNPWHVRALQAGGARRGVALRPGWPAERLVTDGPRIVAVEGPAGRLAAGEFLLAAGAWSAQLLRQVGWAPDIRPIRGQIALFSTGRAGVHPVLMQGKRYLVPRTDGRVLAGSTEEDAGFDARPTGGGIAGLLAFATRLVPALAEATLETCWAGLRPGSPDGMPYLGRVPGCDNLHVAAGHFRAGLQLSPATGLVMAQHLLGRATLVPLEAFKLDRPGA